MENYFGFNKDNHFEYEISTKGTIDLYDNHIIIDPSFLYYMLSEEIIESKFTFYLPDTIVDLINKARDSVQERAFLLGFLNFWGQNQNYDSIPNWNLFYDNLGRMKVIPITEEMILSNEQNNEFAFFLEQFVDHPFYTTLSPLKNVLGDCVGKILLFSKNSGKKILSTTRRLSKLIREKITILIEFPSKIGENLELKKHITSRITKHIPGDKDIKFLISIVLTVGSLGGILATPFGVAGLAYLMLDP